MVGKRTGSLRRSRLAFLLLACAGCNGKAAPTDPTPKISLQANVYINSILDAMQASALKRATINWASFRANVLSVAGAAQTIEDLDPAITRALELLNDGHSSYRSATGKTIFVPNRTCRIDGVPDVQVPANIGYVRVRAFSGTAFQAIQFAGAIQQSIRAQDTDSLMGWIVDLRGNTGGNMWPMLAGIGPVLGTDTVGRFVGPDPTSYWEYRDGAALLSGIVQQQVDNPYTLLRQRPRVAVLTDNGVSSSGEAIAIAFRKRPLTRAFGLATCGLSTANRTFVATDGAILNITAAVMADRIGTSFGDQVIPDETISSTDEIVVRAIAWLKSSG